MTLCKNFTVRQTGALVAQKYDGHYTDPVIYVDLVLGVTHAGIDGKQVCVYADGSGC